MLIKRSVYQSWTYLIVFFSLLSFGDVMESAYCRHLLVAQGEMWLKRVEPQINIIIYLRAFYKKMASFIAFYQGIY